MPASLSTDPQPHFPIEGRSPWVFILPLLAAGSVIAMLTMALVLGGFNENGFSRDTQMILCGVALFLVTEFLFIRFGVAPRLSNYGRYRIYEHKVDFYPLSASGFGVASRPEHVPISKFKGVSSFVVETGGRVIGAGVFLIHPEKSRTLALKSFVNVEDARSYAQSLADAMHISVIPWDNKYFKDRKVL